MTSLKSPPVRFDIELQKCSPNKHSAGSGEHLAGYFKIAAECFREKHTSESPLQPRYRYWLQIIDYYGL